MIVFVKDKLIISVFVSMYHFVFILDLQPPHWEALFSNSTCYATLKFVYLFTTIGNEW